MNILNRFLLLFVLQTSFNSSNAQQNYLNNLVYKKQFTKLETILKSKNLTSTEKNLYASFLLNAFGKAKESNELIKKILNRNAISHFNDTLLFHLHKIQNDNYVKLFDYVNAYKTSDFLLKTYKTFYSEVEYDDAQQELSIWKALSNYPAQTLIKNSDSELPLKKDIAGLWNIPVSVFDTTYQFIFDTGAGISTISETFARRLQLNTIPNFVVKIKSGVTGIPADVRLGIASKLSLGNIEVRNAVFLIFPDSALSFANGKYKINGIVGLPIIKEFKEFLMTPDELIVLAKNKNNDHPASNMILDLLKPILYMNYEGEDFPFTFDTGANTSYFNVNFYKERKELFDKYGIEKDVAFGGTGGEVTNKMIEVPELKFKILDQPVTFKNALISLSIIPVNKDIYYGNIGQDLISQFKRMTVSFVHSYIKFE